MILSEVKFRAFAIAERDLLVERLAGETRSFHAYARVSPDRAARSVGAGIFDSPQARTFSIARDETERIGRIRLFELE